MIIRMVIVNKINAGASPDNPDPATNPNDGDEDGVGHHGSHQNRINPDHHIPQVRLLVKVTLNAPKVAKEAVHCTTYSTS